MESMMEDGVYIPRSTQYSFNNRYYYNPEGAIYRTLYKTRSVADESIYAPTKFTHSHISPLVRPYGRREELRENSFFLAISTSVEPSIEKTKILERRSRYFTIEHEKE
eukprot:PDM81277.1 hypothetical protein PRIPAC_36280 [Pristionchus pacificus]